MLSPKVVCASPSQAGVPDTKKDDVTLNIDEDMDSGDEYFAYETDSNDDSAAFLNRMLMGSEILVSYVEDVCLSMVG